MLLSSCSLGECVTNTAFDHLKKYLEVVKSCLFEVHTITGVGEAGAHAESLEEPWQQR